MAATGKTESSGQKCPVSSQVLQELFIRLVWYHPPGQPVQCACSSNEYQPAGHCLQLRACTLSAWYPFGQPLHVGCCTRSWKKPGWQGMRTPLRCCEVLLMPAAEPASTSCCMTYLCGEAAGAVTLTQRWK